MSIRFTLNGRPVEVADADPNATLLGWLRERGLTGTKEGCAEGECGACAVVLRRAGPDGAPRYEPVNSCLLLLASCADQDVVTVEGVAGGAMHPVQEAMVRLGGSQCGYCTPGFVMSLFAEYYREGRADEGFDVESIAGNLCRCTGYRPIREAGRGLPMVGDDDAHAKRLAEPAPRPSDVSYDRGGRRYFRPTTLKGALEVLARHPDAKIVTGGTDLVVEMNQRLTRFDVLLSLEAVQELRVWDDAGDALTIGAAVSLSEIEERLGDALPMMTGELLPLFSSRLIRNRATLGGNLATASPIGDSPPVLLALGAEVVAASNEGERTIPIDDLFTGYRKTALAPGELLARVRIPKPYPTIGRFYKVSKRVHDDISTVAAGFALELDDAGVIRQARLAYGGVAATPARATDAERALVGQPWSRATVEAAKAKLADAFTPMTDQRGSAAYRAAMVPRLLDKLWDETGART
ncbi:MAG TPA: xanthine dehydrogenase small subunit [Sandaracinaceae bacterium LLY-WYZ-13_1]|nr:xanthine dehydrogenase small subunit [Sandaracinaceae bacterium LLY-WYZ-13_1]